MKKLPVPVGVFDQHIAVLGKTRSGKSSVMRLLVERLLERGEPACIIDPKGDWYGLRLSADGKGPGFDVVIFGDPALAARVDVAINDQVGADVAELLATGNRPALIDLGGWTVGARTRFYVDFAEATFRHTTGDRWIVVDEIHNFAPKGSLKGTEKDAMPKALHWTNRLASEGLGKGLHLIFASQRPQKVHNDTLTSAETLVAMRVLHPSDRGAVSDWIAAAGDQSGKDVLASLADLSRGEGWAWSPEIKFGPERIQFPLFSTYDSFAAQKRTAASLKGWGDVDLGEINEKLARVQEQKKADDPRELRKQLVDKNKEIARLVAQAARQPNPKNDPIRQPKVVEKPVLKDGQLARAEQILGRIDKLAERFSEFEEDLRVTAKEIRDAITSTSHRHTPVQTTAVERPSPQARRVAPAPATSRPARLVSPSPSNGDHRVSRPQQELLNALAWLESVHVHPARRGQVALVARVSSSSSGFEKNLSTLRTAGLIEYPQQNYVALTDAGRAMAIAPDVPPSIDELHQSLYTRVSRPQAELLRKIIDAHPKPIDRESLAEAANVSPTSSGFEKNVSTLRSLGLIDYPQQGMVAAQPVLFLEER